ncbi:hypothetical protein BJ508DRAFT_137253 [Ascobolus immersus RN42]|uniref:CFEM domain-containing protein n=1 Tax=Ascobolus immersus RN42 TaxID=1160509 RepID=A0A3N4I6T9_ASCIM|nr:hypothetical protein BJ508DRAFT_137253 [Ascobolus immersus RN42]
MRFTDLLPVAVVMAATSLVSAQISVGGMPKCAHDCLLEGWRTGDCGGVVACACAQEQFINNVVHCFRLNCESADTKAGIDETIEQCMNVAVEIKLNGPVRTDRITNPSEKVSDVGGPVKSVTATFIDDITPEKTPSSSATPPASSTPSTTPPAQAGSESAKDGSESDSNTKLAVGLGVGLGIAAVLALALGFILLRRRQKKKKALGGNPQELDAEGNPIGGGNQTGVAELEEQKGAAELEEQKEGGRKELSGTEMAPVYEVDGGRGVVEMPGTMAPVELQGNDRFKN